MKSLVSRGETELAVSTNERERRNRRTVTEVSGVVENAPMVLNGKYAQIIFRDYVGSAVSPSGLGGGLGAINDSATN